MEIVKILEKLKKTVLDDREAYVTQLVEIGTDTSRDIEYKIRIQEIDSLCSYIDNVLEKYKNYEDSEFQESMENL